MQVGAVLVEPDDSVEVLIVLSPSSHCCLIIAGRFLAVKNYFSFDFLFYSSQRVSLRVVPWRSAESMCRRSSGATNED